MNQVAESVRSQDDWAANLPSSAKVAGDSGSLYLIEVSASLEADGRVRIDGKASDHNPHKFELVEESFYA